MTELVEVDDTRSVLVWESDEAVRRIIEKSLGLARIAHNAPGDLEKAIGYITSGNADLVTTCFEGLGGWEVIEAARQHKVPFVCITATAHPEKIEGACAVIQKPFSSADLAKQIRLALEGRLPRRSDPGQVEGGRAMSAPNDRPQDSSTAREIAEQEAVSQGRDPKDVAAAMGLESIEVVEMGDEPTDDVIDALKRRLSAPPQPLGDPTRPHDDGVHIKVRSVIGQSLWVAMMNRRTTYAQMAVDIGTDEGTMWQIVNNSQRPSDEVIPGIAIFLGISEEEVIACCVGCDDSPDDGSDPLLSFD